MGRPTTPLSISSLLLLLSPRNSNNNKCDRPSYYWVELPESSFGIQYEVPKPVTSRLSSPPSTTTSISSIIGEQDNDDDEEHSPAKIFSFDMKMLSPKRNKAGAKMMTMLANNTSSSINKRKRIIRRRKKNTPFEVMMKRLNLVASRLPEETAILYIREILEPSDPEFLDCCGLAQHNGTTTRVVRTCQLKESQVQRLRVILLPQRREEILVSCLDHYKNSTSLQYYNTMMVTPVMQHFAGFQRRYATSNSLSERFDLLFGFSFCIHRYSAWMHQYERNRSREKILSALARHWRHLLMKNNAQDLGLDREFSYPAVFCFLDKLKEQIESINMQGLPPLKFVFETEDSPRPPPPKVNDESRVSLLEQDDSFSSVSTITTMTSASI